MKAEFFKSTIHYKNDVLERVASYIDTKEPASLYEPMRYALQAGGKLLRPILAQVSCEAVGGQQKDALDAAAALELVHVFSLVHDDIMDADDMRRGRETVHKKWDANTAILSGDAILIKAYEAIGNVEPTHLPRALQRFNQGILKVCEGQALDIEFEDRDDVTIDEYFAMIDRKTGRLFALACEVGAILGGGTEEQITAMRTYGEKLGRAFQIQDDLLDVLSDQETLGKDVGSDIKEDKKTYLMLYTRQQADADQLNLINTVVRKDELKRSDIESVIKIMTDVGAIASAQHLVKDALSDARHSLDVLPASSSKELLSNLLDFLEHRTY